MLLQSLPFELLLLKCLNKEQLLINKLFSPDTIEENFSLNIPQDIC